VQQGDDEDTGSTWDIYFLFFRLGRQLFCSRKAFLSKRLWKALAYNKQEQLFLYPGFIKDDLNEFILL
jgi:hypothetical protein